MRKASLWTSEHVNALKGEPETEALEFKRFDALVPEPRPSKKDRAWVKAEMCRHVSGMANAQGGVVIYGIAEDDAAKVAGEIEGTSDPKWKPEWFAQVLNDGVQPALPNLEIKRVDVNETIWVIVISVGMTMVGHQCVADKIYWKRHSATKYELSDYEIRDIMRRQTVAELEVTIQLIHLIGPEYSIHVFIENKSVRPGRFVFLEFDLDNSLIMDQLDGEYQLVQIRHPIGGYPFLVRRYTLEFGGDRVFYQGRKRKVAAYNCQLDNGTTPQLRYDISCEGFRRSDHGLILLRSGGPVILMNSESGQNERLT